MLTRLQNTSFALLISLGLFTGSVAFAEDSTTTAEGDATVTTETTTTNAEAGADVTSPRDAASGLPTGKRQHKPVLFQNPQDMRAKATATRALLEDKKEEFQEKRADLREKMVEKRKDVVKRHIQMVFKRLRAAADRLEKLSVRIESRIAKFDERGADTSKAKTSLADANTKIATAKTKVASALAVVEAEATALPEDFASTTPPGSIISSGIQAIKEATKEAGDAIKAAHQALVKTMPELKATAKISGEATTTTP